MKACVAFVLLAGSLFTAAGSTWNPDARLLDAVCQIESSGGRYVYGDDGVSLGYFQIQKGAWSDVSAWRQKRNLETYDYQSNVLNPQISRIYAGDYLTIIHDRLFQQFGREPLGSELYAAYNMGMGNFRKCNYDLAHVNKVTAEKCRQLEALLK